MTWQYCTDKIKYDILNEINWMGIIFLRIDSLKEHKDDKWSIKKLPIIESFWGNCHENTDVWFYDIAITMSINDVTIF